MCIMFSCIYHTLYSPLLSVYKKAYGCWYMASMYVGILVVSKYIYHSNHCSWTDEHAHLVLYYDIHLASWFIFATVYSFFSHHFLCVIHPFYSVSSSLCWFVYLRCPKAFHQLQRESFWFLLMMWCTDSEEAGWNYCSEASAYEHLILLYISAHWSSVKVLFL